MVRLQQKSRYKKKLGQMTIPTFLCNRFTALQAEAFRGAGLELTCLQQVDLKLPLLPAGVPAFRSVHLKIAFSINFIKVVSPSHINYLFISLQLKQPFHL